MFSEFLVALDFCRRAARGVQEAGGQSAGLSSGRGTTATATNLGGSHFLRKGANEGAGASQEERSKGGVQRSGTHCLLYFEEGRRDGGQEGGSEPAKIGLGGRRTTSGRFWPKHPADSGGPLLPRSANASRAGNSSSSDVGGALGHAHPTALLAWAGRLRGCADGGECLRRRSGRGSTNGGGGGRRLAGALSEIPCARARLNLRGTCRPSCRDSMRW